MLKHINVRVDSTFSMELNKNGRGKDENIQHIQGQ